MSWASRGSEPWLAWVPGRHADHTGDSVALPRWNMQQYIDDLSRILREILAAGSARDWDKLIELAKELEELARAERDGNPDENP